jgi:hypothetical protein
MLLLPDWDLVGLTDVSEGQYLDYVTLVSGDFISH